MTRLTDSGTVEYLMAHLGQASSAAVGPTVQASSERVVIAPSLRIPIQLALAGCDMLAAIAALRVLWANALTPALMASGAAVFVIVARILGLYAAGCSADLHKSARGAGAVGCVVLPPLVIITWLTVDGAAAWHVACAIAYAAAAMVFTRLIFGFGLERFAHQVAERVLVVGRCQPLERLLRSNEAARERVKIVGQIAVGDGEPCLKLVGRIDVDVPGAHLTASAPGFPPGGVDRVVILKTEMTDDQLALVLRSLEAWSVPICILVPPPGSRYASMARATTWLLRDAPMTPATLLVKRGLDVAASLVALIVLAPLLLLIALAVRLESPGPALFRQARLGRDNRPFTVFKFRTMRSDSYATDGSVQATRNDPRVTGVGRLLRKTSIDELPQLLNVLMGTMSLVGPRPHPTELNRRFMPLVERYSTRHRMAPGITGLAQINGFRGETKTVEQMQRRVELDLEYIREHSIGYDLWILLRTVVALVKHRDAY